MGGGPVHTSCGGDPSHALGLGEGAARHSRPIPLPGPNDRWFNDPDVRELDGSDSIIVA
jgi:hypothetical protein